MSQKHEVEIPLPTLKGTIHLYTMMREPSAKKGLGSGWRRLNGQRRAGVRMADTALAITLTRLVINGRIGSEKE